MNKIEKTTKNLNGQCSFLKKSVKHCLQTPQSPNKTPNQIKIVKNSTQKFALKIIYSVFFLSNNKYRMVLFNFV